MQLEKRSELMYGKPVHAQRRIGVEIWRKRCGSSGVVLVELVLLPLSIAPPSSGSGSLVVKVTALWLACFSAEDPLPTRGSGYTSDRIVAGLVTSSSLVPIKTQRVGQRCALNLLRAQTSFRWYGVEVRSGAASSGVVLVT
ncbi:hypothetical protein TNCV_4786001 [Trichonephila clavipes]|nr:hypothetical protein TNCV_4786001 [Trichonephila clavipes]